MEWDTLDTGHRHSMLNRGTIAKSQRCGCFKCLRIFEPREVVDWIDEGKTALCPSCGIDSVIGDAAPVPATDPEFLTAMKAYWFAIRPG